MISGSTAGAYFARGDGSQTNPYVINQPIHLYNLAWLQDMGFFDKEETYFIIEADLDMSGWVIPPIGTTDHPFIGHLDGFDETYSRNQSSAAVISNLKISNSFSDFIRKPSKATSETISSAKEVGFLGTFGKEGESYEDGKEPTAKNFYLNDLEVSTSSNEALVGMAAGYVNGTLDNVGISDSKITAKSSTSYGTYTSNISDYTTVGYAEDKYKVNAYEKKITTKASDLVLSSGSDGDGGNAAGNGGSIDMQKMYNELLTAYNASSSVKVDTAETITYDIDGNVINKQVTSQSNLSNSDLKCYRQKYEDMVSASYSFNDRTDTVIYVYGKSSGTSSSQTKTVTEIRPTKFYGRTISDSTSSHYLSASGGLIQDVSSGEGNIWFFINGLLSYEDGNATYYLIDNNGTLGITTSESSATKWTYDSDNKSYKSESNHLLEYDSQWTLGEVKKYKIYGSNYYLTNSGTSLSLTSNKSSAVSWQVDSDDRYYCKINNINYYLSYSSSGSRPNRTYTPTLSTSASNCLKLDSSNRFYYESWFITYYLYISNDSIQNLSRSNETTFELIDDPFVGLNVIENNNYTIYDVQSSYKTNATYETNPTYLPISGTNGVPDKNNTGYVLSGSYDPYGQGDIRVAKYSIDKIGSYSSSSKSLDTVYTVNESGSGTTVLESNFNHYTETKEKFEKILSNSDDYVYGLHFMSSTISMEHIIEADYARIGDVEYKNQGYELPEDSIDFNLQRKGYVSFFAGTYYNGTSAGRNKSFFSFHEVEREGTKIKNIREIVEIYQNPTARQSQSYVYKYSDGTYSVPFLHGSKTGIKYDLNGNPLTNDEPTLSLPDGYTSTIFKTSWLKGNENLKYDAAYYFEVPCNAGEYALGSVPGYAGAYLDYLDIGANAQRTDVTQIVGLKEISTYTYSYPKGVSFSFISDDSTVALPTIDAKNNASFSLGSSFSGDISVSRTDATDSSTTASTSEISYTSSSDSVITEYKDREVTVKGNGTVISEATGVINEKITIKSITKIAYSLFSSEATSTEYRDTTTETYENGTVKNTSETKVVYTNGEEDSTQDWLVDLPWNTEVKETSKTYVYYLEGNAVTINISTNLVENFDSDEQTYYYKLGGYSISYTSDVDLTIELISLSDNELTIKVITGNGEEDYIELEIGNAQDLEAKS